MSIILLIIVALIALFFVRNIRLQFVTRPVLAFFRKVLPPLSDTEREAMEAGDVWWEAELFRGKPNWESLHAYGKPH